MNRALLAVCALVLVMALIALAPLGLALGALGLERVGVSALGARGTVWSGRLEGARLQGADLGEVSLRTHFLPLLGGMLRVRTAATGGAMEGRATVGRRGDTVSVDGATGSAPLSMFRNALPGEGRLVFENVGVRFADGRCDGARGRVRLEGLQVFGLGAVPLSGQAACDGEALLLPFSGRMGDGDLNLSFRLLADGRYRVQTRVVSADPRATAALRLAGFVDTGAGATRTEEGRLWR